MKKYIVPMLILLLIAGSAFASPVAIEGHAVVTDLPEAILLIVFGCVVGLIGTLIGAGGGFIHVPMLMIFFDFSPQLAIGTSITAVFYECPVRDVVIHHAPADRLRSPGR